MKARLRRAAFRLIALTLAAGVALLAITAIELGSWGVLRLKGKTAEPFGRRYSVHPTVRYVPWVGLLYPPLTAEVRTGLGTDRHGFIHNGDASRDLSVKAPGVYRIFITGGSPVAGLDDPARTIAGRLETLLNERAAGTGRTYQVVNAAMEGYLSSQELGLIAYYLRDYAPDLIVSISGFNDVFQVIRAPREGYHPNISGHLTQMAEAAYRHTYSPAGTFSQALGMLRARSYAFNVWDEMRAMVRARTGRAGPSTAPPKPLGPDPLRYYTRNVEMMMAVSNALGSAHAAVLMPTVLLSNSTGKPHRDAVIAQWRSSWTPVDYWGEKEQLFRESREAFAALGARYDDGRRIVVRDYSRLLDEEREPFYIDQSHYTLAGNDVIARRLADDLLASVLRAPEPR